MGKGISRSFIIIIVICIEITHASIIKLHLNNIAFLMPWDAPNSGSEPDLSQVQFKHQKEGSQSQTREGQIELDQASDLAWALIKA